MDAVAPMFTLLFDGWVVIDGDGVALTATEAVLEVVLADTPSFVDVATQR